MEMMAKNLAVKQKRYHDGLFNLRFFLPEETRQRIAREKIDELFSSLSRRQQTALTLRYGLEVGKSHTYKQIAEILGGTPQAAEQLVRRAKRRLIAKL